MDSRTARRDAAQRREDETIYCDAVSYALLWSVNQIVQQTTVMVLMLTAFGYAAPTSADEPLSVAYRVLVSVWLAAVVTVFVIRIIEDFHSGKWRAGMSTLSFFVLIGVTLRLDFTDNTLEDQIREGDTIVRSIALVLVLASLLATGNFNISDRLLRTRQRVSMLTAGSLALVASLVAFLVATLNSDVSEMISVVAMLASCYAWHEVRSTQHAAR